MSKIKTTEWNASKYLKTDGDIFRYLSLAFDDGDIRHINLALSNVAKIKGMAKISKVMKVSRTSLYKSLSENSSPEFRTVNNLLNSLRIKLALVPMDAEEISTDFILDNMGFIASPTSASTLARSTYCSKNATILMTVIDSVVEGIIWVDKDEKTMTLKEALFDNIRHGRTMAIESLDRNALIGAYTSCQIQNQSFDESTKDLTDAQIAERIKLYINEETQRQMSLIEKELQIKKDELKYA